MQSVVVSIIVANLAATASALLLARRGPTRRLKLLTLTVGLMALAQTTGYLQSQGIWNSGGEHVASIHQSLAALLSLMAIYLLGSEIYDRSVVDRKLRLTEHEILSPVKEVLSPDMLFERAAGAPQPGEEEGKGPVDRRKLHEKSLQATMEIMQLLGQTSTDGETPAQGGRRLSAPQCEECRTIAADMARSWMELHFAMETPGQEGERLRAAKGLLAGTIRRRWDHEMRAQHEIMEHPFRAKAPEAAAPVEQPEYQHARVEGQRG
jgi:hypothetical protein